MTPQAIMGGLNIVASAAPLLFGPNSIFSGKLRQAEKEQMGAFKRSQAMQLPTEYTQALQNRLAQANVGIPSAALGLYQQQAARGLSTQMAGLRDRRSALAGAGSLAQAGQDAALQLAAMQGQAIQTGQERANQALMQMGGLKYQEELRKQEEAQQFWGGRKAEAAGAQSAALAGLGQAVGTALATDAFKAQPKLGFTPAAPTANVPRVSDMLQSLSALRQSSPYANQMGIMSRPQLGVSPIFTGARNFVTQQPFQYSAFSKSDGY